MPNKPYALVTGGDKNYFPVMVELLHSFRRFPQSQDFGICIIDVGLTEDQRQWLKSFGVDQMVTPDWPCPLPASKIKGKDYLKACVCRPEIPKLFSNYELYIWLDADVWLQNWQVIDLLIVGAKRGKLTITSNADRGYPRAVMAKYFLNIPIKLKNFYFNNAEKPFGKKIARFLLERHVLQAGAFSLLANAPHWQRWQDLVKQALLNGGRIFTAEQTSLGVLTYKDNYPYELLPAWTHWYCDSPLLYDETQQQFVEPFLPHMPLSTLHLSGVDEIRASRQAVIEVELLGGGKKSMSLRYPLFNGELLG